MFDTPVMPASGYLEMVLAASRDAYGERPLSLDEVSLPEMLALPEGGRRHVQVTLARAAGERADFGVYSQEGDDWRLHVSGVVNLDPPEMPFEPFDRALAAEDAAGSMEPGAYYRRMKERALAYGPGFRTIEQVAWGKRSAYGRVALPADAVGSGYTVHPALLDGCLQLVDAALILDDLDDRVVLTPVSVGSYQAFMPARGEVWATVRVATPDGSLELLSADLDLFDDDGGRIASVRGLQVRLDDQRVVREQVLRAIEDGGGQVKTDSWRYEPTWRPVPPVAPVAAAAGTWLVLPDAAGLGDAVAAELDSRGHRSVVAHGGEWHLDDIERPAEGWAGVVFAVGLDLARAEPTLEGQQRALGGLLTATQSLLDGEQGLAGRGPRLWVLTSGARRVDEKDAPVSVAQAPLWGLAGTIGLEEPSLRTACIDLEPDATGLAGLVVDEVLGDSEEDQVAYRSGRRHVGRLARLRAGPVGPGQTAGQSVRLVSANGTYLITGGLGGLGLEAARSLARRGARHLVLMGRSKPSDEAELLIEELRSTGATVRCVRADVADREQLDGALREVRETMPPLCGVIHAAGVIDDGLVRNLDWSRFEAVLRPKLLGVWHLHDLTLGDPIDTFVLYSSAASLLGATAQGNYAAANAFLDALSHHRWALGLPAVSINWGAWSSVGMAAGLDDASRRRLERLGIGLIDPVEGDAVLGSLIASAPAQVGVMSVDWARMALGADSGMSRPFLELVATPSPTSPLGAGSPRFLDELAAADEHDRFDLVRDHVRASIAAVLGLPSAEALAGDLDLAELGMDSLMAVELRNRLQRTSAVALESTVAFMWPTVDALSQHLAELLDVQVDVLRVNGRSGPAEVVIAPTHSPASPSSTTSSLDPIPVVSRREPLPASPAQRRFLFMADFDPTAAVFNVGGAIRIVGELDVASLTSALSGVVRRHESLRTNFEVVDGEILQMIAEPAPVCVEHRDLRSTSPGALDGVVAQAVDTETARPFDVHHDVKLRALLLHIGPDEHVLVTTTHHIAADGWSMGRVLRDLEELYEASVKGSPPELPDLPIQYADYAAWERQQLALPAALDQLSYWRDQLGGNLPVLSLPTDRPRPPIRTHHGASFRFAVPSDLLAAVKASSREAGVTPFMMLLASYMATLALHAGQDEIVVGTVSANRSRPEVLDLVGPFVNTLAVRAAIDPDSTFTGLLDHVRRTAIEAYTHQDVPFDRVVEAVSPPRDLSRSPIFQTMFVLQNVPIPDLHLADLDLEPIPTSLIAVDVDLTMELLEMPTGMTGTLKFSTDLFDTATIEQLVMHWLELLASAAADRERPVRELSMLSAREREQLLVDWSLDRDRDSRLSGP